MARVSEERLDTAHEVWDEWWGEAKQRARWSEPDPAVTSFIPMLLVRGARRVVDVGAGIGRHTLVYARARFHVTAADASPTGLDELVRAAQAEGLAVDARIGFVHGVADRRTIPPTTCWPGTCSTTAMAPSSGRRWPSAVVCCARVGRCS